MAMTKAEKAEMDALREARDMARALRWPEYPEPEPMGVDEIKANQTFKMKPRWGSDQYACVGFAANFRGSYDRVPEVYRVFSNGLNTTADPNGQHWSQGGARMYRTEADALQKLRLDLTAEFAAKLAAVDAMLAELPLSLGDKQ